MKHEVLTAAPHDVLSGRDFHRIAALVTRHSGIKLPDSKKVMLEGRVRKRARAAGFQSISSYCDHLFQEGAIEAEIGHLVDAATTNKTDFFREPPHFDFLADRIVAPAASAGRCLKLWSAASSTGAEAYTMAMVLAEAAATLPGLRWSILATDICRTVLADAKRAIYPAEMVAPVPKPMQSRYVMRSRAAEAVPRIRIVPELRRTVRFAQLNLMDRQYPVDSDFDAIFLRNVLIYFEKPDQEAVVLRISRHLRPGGFLMLGHSESMIGSSLGLRQVAPATFQVL
jgi:chemotaxis protein methyltransferase CheR